MSQRDFTGTLLEKLASIDINLWKANVITDSDFSIAYWDSGIQMHQSILHRYAGKEEDQESHRYAHYKYMLSYGEKPIKYVFSLDITKDESDYECSQLEVTKIGSLNALEFNFILQGPEIDRFYRMFEYRHAELAKDKKKLALMKIEDGEHQEKVKLQIQEVLTNLDVFLLINSASK